MSACIEARASSFIVLVGAEFGRRGSGPAQCSLRFEWSRAARRALVLHTKSARTHCEVNDWPRRQLVGLQTRAAAAGGRPAGRPGESGHGAATSFPLLVIGFTHCIYCQLGADSRNMLTSSFKQQQQQLARTWPSFSLPPSSHSIDQAARVAWALAA